MKVRIEKPNHRGARPVAVRIKTGVRAGGNVVMPNHNSTLVAVAATRKARPASVRIKTGVRAGGDLIMPNHNGTLVVFANRKARPASA